MSINLSDYRNREPSKTQKLTALIKAKTQKLSRHEIYSQLTSSVRFNCFMSYHIFAVWDFIKILKSLQIKTSIALQKQLPEWSSETKELIEQIIFAEESTLCPYGQPTENFAFYIRAVLNIKSDFNFLWTFLTSKDDLDLLKPGIKELVEYNIKIAEAGTLGEMAAVFFCGREQLNSHFLDLIIKISNQEGQECLILNSYTKDLNQKNNYQAEIIGLELLNYLCKDENEKVIALQAGLEALALREQLWDYALAEITEIM